MNTAQILRQALYDLDAVSQDSTTDPFYVQAEMLAWANDGKDELEKALRAIREDYGLVVLQDDDAAFTWGHETYSPSALTVAAGTKYVTLPPDCLTLRRIRVLTDGYERTRFVKTDLSRDDAKELEAYTSSYPLGDAIYYDIVGERTLYLANTLSTTLNLEIAYIARSLPLQLYSTGTVTINNGASAVTGGGTAWVAQALHHNVELMVSADATAPKIVSQTAGGTWVDATAIAYPIATITGDGAATLAANWPLANVVAVGYLLATVPTVPPEHHHLLVDYVAHRGLEKAKDYGASDRKLKAFRDALAVMKGDAQQRQGHDVETVEDWIPA